MQLPTDFQIQTERALVEALAERGRALADYRMGGESGIVVHARVAGTPLEIYLYEDGAGLLAPEGSAQLDGADFASPESLRAAFLEAVLGYLDGVAPGE